VAKVTERFGERAGDIDGIITDAQQIAARLNEASKRVDGVLARVDSLLGSGEAEGLMSDAGETLRAFREVADTLNARMGTITDGLARFSGQGLREVESLVRDSRRSITRIEQAITDLERNPQRIITGGAGSVREYDGRARR
jgi:phospholipid/cholesterol/gamma-HCH transport system substrate-binding protein